MSENSHTFRDHISAAAARRKAEVARAGHVGAHDTAHAGLADTDPGVRSTALAALQRLGRLTDDDLAAAADDPSPVVRRRAAELAVTHPSVDVVPLLADSDPMVVEAAAFALGERAVAAGVVPALAAVATGHDDPLAREAAVAALGSLGDPDGLPAILAATTDKPAVRRRAVLALAPFDGPEVDAALTRALGDRDWQVRQAAEDLGATPGDAS